MLGSAVSDRRLSGVGGGVAAHRGQGAEGKPPAHALAVHALERAGCHLPHSRRAAPFVNEGERRRVQTCQTLARDDARARCARFRIHQTEAGVSRPQAPTNARRPERASSGCRPQRLRLPGMRSEAASALGAACERAAGDPCAGYSRPPGRGPPSRPGGAVERLWRSAAPRRAWHWRGIRAVRRRDPEPTAGLGANSHQGGTPEVMRDYQRFSRPSPFHPRLTIALDTPEPARSSIHGALRAMARPGLEPGTPRFQS